MYKEEHKREEEQLFHEHSKDLSMLFKFYQILSVINDILLVPMFASIIIENFEHTSLELMKTGEQTSNMVFCSFFFMEWLLGCLLADNKLLYVRTPTRILDFISALPLGSIVQGARFFRLLRVIKVFRLIARAKKYSGPGKELLYVLSTLFAVTFSSAYTILLIEGNTNPQFENIKDALWWSFVTISSVGYGDKIPSTDVGRLIAVVLMMAGIGICGYIAAWFMSISTIDVEEKQKSSEDLEEDLKQMKEQLSELSQKVDLILNEIRK